MALLKLNTVFLFSILTLFSSCNGQDASSALTNDSIHPDSSLELGTVVTELPANLIIFQDSQNNYWFAGGDGGAYKYNGVSLVLFTVKDGLSDDKIIGIQEDEHGNIYFDTSEGVSKFDGQKFTTIEVITSDSDKNEWKLEPNDLWFRMGWDENGPYRYDGESLYQLEFPKPSHADAFYSKYPNVSYSPYGIYKMYKDSKGNMWFGTATLGICRYDGESLSWLYEKHLTDTPEGGSFGIRSIIEDKSGQYWFCNTHYSYEIMPSSSEKSGTNYINYRRENGLGYSNDNSEIEFPYFMSIAEDNQGDLWMATYSDGVWRNNGEKLIHYPIKIGDTDVLLFSIYIDNQGIIWLGTHNAGVYKYNGSDFEKFEP